MVLFRLALNCIRGRYRSPSGVMIFTPKLIRRPEHLAFLEKEDGLASLDVIGRRALVASSRSRILGSRMSARRAGDGDALLLPSR